MLYVIATITAQPGKRAELLRMFLEHAPQALADPGCVEYRASLDSELFDDIRAVDPDAFTVVERWETASDLRAHLKAPHMREYAKHTSGLVKARDVRVLNPVLSNP